MGTGNEGVTDPAAAEVDTMHVCDMCAEPYARQCEACGAWRCEAHEHSPEQVGHCEAANEARPMSLADAILRAIEQGGAAHGYVVGQRAAELMGEPPGVSALYDTLCALVTEGLIEEFRGDLHPVTGRPRVMYRVRSRWGTYDPETNPSGDFLPPLGLLRANIDNDRHASAMPADRELLVRLSDVPGFDPRGCRVRPASGGQCMIPEGPGAPWEMLDFGHHSTRDAAARWMYHVLRPGRCSRYSTAPTFRAKLYTETDEAGIPGVWFWALGGDHPPHDPEWVFVTLGAVSDAELSDTSKLPDGTDKIVAVAMARAAWWVGSTVTW